MKCLRSCIENILFCEYYKDHPVELRLWLKGRHRLGFREIMSYFQRHPDVEGTIDDLSGLERLQTEYSILSRAVFWEKFLINGGDVFTLQQILGHSTLEMVKHYVNLASNHVVLQHRRFSPLDRMNLQRV